MTPQTELPNDVDIDLDEILDIEDENQRKKFVRGILNNSKSSKEIINVSIGLNFRFLILFTNKCNLVSLLDLTFM